MNVTDILQLAFAATLVPQVLVWLYAPGADPVRLIPLTGSADTLWLVRAMTRGAEATPIGVLTNPIDVGETLTAAINPESAIACGEP